MSKSKIDTHEFSQVLRSEERQCSSPWLCSDQRDGAYMRGYQDAVQMAISKLHDLVEKG